MRQKWPIVALVFVTALYFGGQGLLDLWARLLWFSSNHQTAVYMKLLEVRGEIFAGAFLLFFLIFSLILRPLLRGTPGVTLGRHIPGGPSPLTLEASFVRRASETGLLLLSLFLALPYSGTGNALRLLAAINAPATPERDPILHLHLSFYLFHLPLYDDIVSLTLEAFLIAAFLAAIMGLMTRRIFLGEGTVRLDPSLLRPLLHALAGISLVLSIEALLARTRTLLSRHQGFSGASYTDLHARIPVSTLLAGTLALLALALLVESFREKKILSKSLAMTAGTLWVAGLLIFPWGLSRFVVLPNQFNQEKPFIGNNIEATRKAFGVDRGRSERIATLSDLTSEDITHNMATIRNIRLWDHRPMLTTVRQLQQIRTYYTFPILATDRYMLDGSLRQVLVAPREISYPNLPSPNWINVHLTYTHGHGLIMSPVNRVTNEGLPEFWLRDIPPVSSVPLTLLHSRIYYGDQASPYAIVNTRIPEFDYPKGRQNISNHYDAKGGIRLSDPLRRLLYSYEYGTLKIFLSSAITPESRILVHRNIFDIVHRLAPFLSLDPDVVPIIGPQGRLLWMMDAYTTSRHYPNATAISAAKGFFHIRRLFQGGHRKALASWKGEVNYIRNPVKVLIDPKTGMAHLYVIDPSDPILAAYRKSFPTLFSPLSDLPAEVGSHLRFPPALFSLQASILAAYHMTDPQVFFNREDLWSLATRDDRPLAPYYMVMRLPGETQEEYVMMLPYTPAHRDNLSAWLVGRQERGHMGELRIYRSPKERLVYGPNQIEARIDQQGPISKQLTLWNQQGSHVVRGTLLIIPVAQSLLYVEPLYLAATSPGSLPELRRVIVSMGDRVVMKKTLAAALEALFSGAPPAGLERSGTPVSVSHPGKGLRRLKRLGREAEEAMKRGDLSLFGDRVQKILKALEGQ